jgi:hypothetical protein
MNGNGTIDVSRLVEQLSAIAWRMAEALPDYLPFLLAGGLLILVGNILRRPRALAVGASRHADGWDEDGEGSPVLAIVINALRLTAAMVMRLAGRMVVLGCLVVLILRASGFEKTTAFVDANFEALSRIVQAFR